MLTKHEPDSLKHALSSAPGGRHERRIAPRAPELLALLEGHHSYVAEMQRCVIEVNSDVVDDLEALHDELTRRRRFLAEKAAELDLMVVASGTVPLAVPSELPLTSTSRFRQMLADYQLLAREQLICGTQVHVGVDDRDDAVAISERVASDLPTLSALSASSPFSSDGHDTGYASVRALIWSRWPTAGLSSGTRTAAELDALVETLVDSGVITDPGMMYFDTRPSARIPTLELRICDSCPSSDTILLIAGFFRAMVDREYEAHKAGEPVFEMPGALGRAATWRAARSGLEEDLVDLRAGHSAPAGRVVHALVDSLEPWLRRNGDWETITSLAEGALSLGSSAARQRRVLRNRGRLTDVVDLLAAETAHATFEAAAGVAGGGRASRCSRPTPRPRRPEPACRMSRLSWSPTTRPSTSTAPPARSTAPCSKASVNSACPGCATARRRSPTSRVPRA